MSLPCYIPDCWVPRSPSDPDDCPACYPETAELTDTVVGLVDEEAKQHAVDNDG